MKIRTPRAERAFDTRKSTGTPASASRRRFVVGTTAAAGGGLALGFALPGTIRDASGQAAAQAVPEINAWVVVRPDDTVAIRVVRS